MCGLLWNNGRRRREKETGGKGQEASNGKGRNCTHRKRCCGDGGMEEISLGGEGPGSDGPLYYLIWSPEAVNETRRGGEARQYKTETDGGSKPTGSVM